MTTMTDATQLNLINKIDEKTGASVAMWRDVNAAPVEWGALLTNATEHNGSADYACTECGHLSTGQVPECSCAGCDV